MSEKWDRIGWVMGLSAQAIAGGGRNHPHDPSDLVRCVKYMESRCMTTEELCARMAGRSVEWDRLTAHWDDLVTLLKHEVETSTDGMAYRTYIEMKRVMADGVPCEACNATGRGTECAKCKGTGRRAGGRCRAENCWHRGANYCSVCRGKGYLDRSRPGLGTAGVTGAQPDEPASQAGRPVGGGS